MISRCVAGCRAVAIDEPQTAQIAHDDRRRGVVRVTQAALGGVHLPQVKLTGKLDGLCAARTPRARIQAVVQRLALCGRGASVRAKDELPLVLAAAF